MFHRICGALLAVLKVPFAETTPPVGFPNQPRACAQPARQLMRQNRRARLPFVKNEPGRRPAVRLPLSRRGNHTAFTTLVPAARPPQKSPSRAMPGLRINAQPLRELTLGCSGELRHVSKRHAHPSAASWQPSGNGPAPHRHFGDFQEPPATRTSGG